MRHRNGNKNLKKIEHSEKQPCCSVFNCCWKNSISFIDTTAHDSQWSTGSMKHMRVRAHLDEQHLPQKHWPQRRQWCCKHPYTSNIYLQHSIHVDQYSNVVVFFNLKMCETSSQLARREISYHMKGFFNSLSLRTQYSSLINNGQSHLALGTIVIIVSFGIRGSRIGSTMTPIG